MALPRHPDFAEIQERMRRIHPDFYPARIAIDDQYGPSMARGVDMILDALEDANDLPPWDTLKRANRVGQMPSKFNFLLQDPKAPLMVRLALEFYGLKEKPGAGNNSEIIQWADEIAESVDTPYANWAADWYNKDSIPWCGLWMAVVAVRASQGRAERMPPVKYLSALEWQHYGEAVAKEDAAVGDVMVLGRNGGGHVCINVGMEEGNRRFFGLGANQSDAVNILPFGMNRVRYVRRPPYNNRPAGARQVVVGRGGASSVNEQ